MTAMVGVLLLRKATLQVNLYTSSVQRKLLVLSMMQILVELVALKATVMI
jgi:hypothetical protein